MPIQTPFLARGEWPAAGADAERPQRPWNSELDSHRSRDRALLSLFPFAFSHFSPMNGLKLLDQLFRWKHLLVFRVPLQIRRGKRRTRFRVERLDFVTLLDPHNTDGTVLPRRHEILLSDSFSVSLRLDFTGSIHCGKLDAAPPPP